MVDKILEEFEHKIDSVTIIPGKGGVFEVTAGDELVYSKKATGRHAEVQEVIDPLRELIG